MRYMGFFDKLKRAISGGKEDAEKAGKAVEHGAEKAEDDVSDASDELKKD